MCVACSELEPLPTVMERASTVRTMRIEALSAPGAQVV